MLKPWNLAWDTNSFDMKKIWLLISVIFLNCTDHANCIFSGKNSIVEYQLSAFNEVEIPKNVTVQIVPDTIYKVKIYAKENILPHIKHQQNYQRLIISNSAICQSFQSSENALIQLHTPTIEKIYSKTQHKVFSLDTLHFPTIKIINNSYSKVGSTHFDLLVNSDYIYLEDNQVAKFELKGKTKKLSIALYGGNCSVHAQQLKADTVQMYQRSNQHLYVHPLHKIVGTIASTGNVYASYRPAQIDVQELYKGSLIFE